MNVPNIGQIPGSAPLQPRTDAGAEQVADHRAEPGALKPGPAHAAAPTISLTQLACFDVNGDGMLDSRSAAAGGDGTLLVPTHGADLPTYSRAANRAVAPRPARAHDADGAHGGPARTSANVARANQAADAYQRYGLAPASGDASAAALVPTPPPAAGPGPVPGSATPAGLSPGASADLTATRGS